MAELIALIFAFAPLFLILVVANVAQSRREAEEEHAGLALTAYLLLAIIYLAGIFIGVMLQLSQVVLQQQPELMEQLGLLGDDLTAQVASLTQIGLGIWIPSVLGLILLLPPVRRVCARFTALDPAHPVHAVALSMSMMVLINLFLTLGIGLDNLTATLEAQNELDDGTGGMSIAALWGQQLLMALLAVVGVGWLTRRTGSQVLKRLGLVRPSRRELVTGAAWGLALVPMVILMEGLAGLVGLGADPDVEALTEQLLGPLFQSPFGILTLGLAAALGEETLFRGAAQPRFTLVPTALLFALLHSNYGITFSTVIVFALGLVLGWLRIRHNTSTAMVTHALYNGTLGLIAYLSLSFLEF